jgi:PIN domain nuclease of toxin-antitoxin system
MRSKTPIKRKSTVSVAPRNGMKQIAAGIQQLISDVTVIPITLDIAVLTAHFPPDFPSDPMDRIIAATARAENLPLVTADERILRCPLLKTIW